MKKLNGLPPIIDKNSRVLILGTFPGGESLMQEKYYAHGTNSFWKLLFTVFNKPFSNDYTVRLNLLSETKIAVWDVIESCFREGSSDKKINDPTPNDIPSLLKSYPNIKTIVITSGDVRKYLFQFFPALRTFQNEQIISSSSGTVGVSFNEKLGEWIQLIELVK